jgi:acetyltransferase-like isoleucine patch superfamily enzyme
MDPLHSTKVKDLRSATASGFSKYRSLYYGHVPFERILLAEVIIGLTDWLPGGLGLLLRSRLYPWLFTQAGRGCVFGRNMTIRHAHKIRLGDRVILDDGCTVDAKGDTNHGITIGNDVFVGRNTSIYCKNGNITIGDRVNISSNCLIMSTNSITIQEGTIVAAFCYIMSGGEYETGPGRPPFAEQDGMKTRGELVIGRDSWIGAGVKVLDGACIGEQCVIGAGAVVTRPVPAHSLAIGIPARVRRSL